MRTFSLGFFLVALMAAQARGEDAPPESSAPPSGEAPAAATEAMAPESTDAVASSEDSSDSGVLEDGEGVVSDAATRRMGKADKKARPKGKARAGKHATIKGGGAAASGADSEEGWIIRKTPDGYVKVPAKQTFRFEGDVSGQANRPTQSVLGQRPSYRPSTLIPERTSFRKEFLEAAGTGR